MGYRITPAFAGVDDELISVAPRVEKALRKLGVDRSFREVCDSFATTDAYYLLLSGGFLVFHLMEEFVTGKKGIFVDFAALWGQGAFEESREIIEQIAEIEGLDFVEIHTPRPGFLKRSKMLPELGYKVGGYTLRKERAGR